MAILTSALAAIAQELDPTVDLAKVKISERQEADELCPIHPTPPGAAQPAWTFQGVLYRGLGPECERTFATGPAGFAHKAARERWVNNVVADMSIMWCPLMLDRLNSGGGHCWTWRELVWEACGHFCAEAEPSDEDFAVALEGLKAYAHRSYRLTGGQYVEGAKSPVEDAIRWNRRGTEEEEGEPDPAPG